MNNSESARTIASRPAAEPKGTRTPAFAEGNYPATTFGFKHVTGQFCDTCIKRDVCSIQQNLQNTIERIEKELDTVNVFAEGIINCKRYYPDMEHQIQPLCDYDYARASSNPSSVRTVLLQNGGMSSNAD